MDALELTQIDRDIIQAVKDTEVLQRFYLGPCSPNAPDICVVLNRNGVVADYGYVISRINRLVDNGLIKRDDRDASLRIAKTTQETN